MNKSDFNFRDMEHPARLPLVVTLSDPLASPLHGHDFIEVVLVQSGHAVHEGRDAGGRDFINGCIRGDLFVLHPGDRHRYRETVKFNIINLIFLPRLIAGNLTALNTLPAWPHIFSPGSLPDRLRLHLLPGECNRAEALLLDIKNELQLTRGDDFHRLKIKAALIEFFLLVGADASANWSPMSDAPEPAVAAAVAAVEKQPVGVSVPKLARKFGMSESAFARRFKRAVGLAPVEYALTLRLDEARRKLVETGLSISEIALSCGFCDGNYLIKLFHRQYGITPARYRRRSPGNRRRES